MPQPTIAHLLEELLTGEGAKARIAVARAALEDQLLSIYKTTGSAPTLRLPLGTVSLSVPKPHPEITDADAFASWVAQRHPSEVETSLTITGVPAQYLPAVLDAVGGAIAHQVQRFAGEGWTEAPQVTGRVGVREAFRTTVLDSAVGDRDTPGAQLFAADTLEQIDGLQVVEPSGSPSMSVRLDKEAKARAIVTARAAAENDLAADPAPAGPAGMPTASPEPTPEAQAAGDAAGERILAFAGNPGPPPGQPTGRAGVVRPAPLTAPAKASAAMVEQADVDDDVEPDRDEPRAQVEDPCGTPLADGETCGHAKDAHGGAKHNGACKACANSGQPAACSRYRKARNTRTATRVPAKTGA